MSLPFAKVLANVGDEVTPVDVVAERTGQPVPVITAQLLDPGVYRVDRSCTRRLCPIKEGMPCSTY
ncbi:hypothetical protein FD729_01695 [Pantoea sp. Nvir]|nr:hypothetical protein [Pantoea sp. Nvir]MXP66487.1 hypothetical protein [Pantoea sp. Nvir]